MLTNVLLTIYIIGVIFFLAFSVASNEEQKESPLWFFLIVCFSWPIMILGLITGHIKWERED